MGRAGRFACIFVPMALSIATALLLVIIAFGGLNKNSSFQSSLFLYRANTTNISNGPNGLSIDGVAIGPQVSGSNTTANVTVADFYQVYLWNYCSGDANGTITFCSPRTTSFWFNPEEAWGLSNTLANQVFSTELKDGLSIYQKTAHFAFIIFVIAFASTAATVLVGLFAICSRWGSLVTTIFASISTVFTIAWAGCITGMYAVLAGVFDSAFKANNVNSTLGTKALAVVWLAVACSVIAGLFWTISICCCSGRSSGNKDRGSKTYERVPSPYGHAQQPSPQLQWNGEQSKVYAGQPHLGYEPYRQTV